MIRRRNSFGPLIGYHGCCREIAEDILSNKLPLNSSRNEWDWLGAGIYFWVDSWARGIDWAFTGKKIKEPYVIGAYVHPGLCLNLTDYAVSDQVKEAYDIFKEYCDSTRTELPKNKSYFQRNLDCAVLEFLHTLREDRKLPAYDTVLGAFEEGDALFEGSHFKKKTHLQLAVREGHEDCIIGYFRVPGIEKEISELKNKP